MSTRVSKATAALIIIDQLHTVKATGGVAGFRQTFVEIAFAVFSNKSWRAGACVTAYTIHTLTPIQTARLRGARLGGTVILIDFTLDSVRSMWTGAGKAVDEIDTGSTVETRCRVTFVNIILTVHPLVAWFTSALVRALIIHTSSTVATWI